ncbi:MAG: YgeY family selenium metabolism-linked hydrolase, partial [Thermoprotei archaeon]
MNDLIKIVKSLIETPSLSGEEKDIAYLIRDFLNDYGVDKSFIDKYGNVIGIIKGGLNRTIVFEGHMDHVPPGNISNWKYDPYKPEIIENRIYGRGAVDMKGAIGSMIYSIPKVSKKDIPSIYYIFVPYEEISEGVLFKKALEETLNLRPDLVVLGEATNLDLYIGQRGR